jgi:uncharacterized protein YndB with AHSA1/START domain
MESSQHLLGVIQTSRTISSTPQEIYAAFADPARLAKWWGPKDFTNTFEVFEFRPGGKWKFLMHGPDGSTYRNEAVFTNLVPGKRMVIRHISAPHFTLTITLSPDDAGTLVQWVQEFEEPTVAEAIRHIAEPGNEQNLDRLQMHLRSGG